MDEVSVTTVHDATPSTKENLKNEMISYIAIENKAYFKSQQIDDPEITLEERKKILKTVLNSSHAKFLSRFGPYLNPEHFLYFEQQNYHPEEKYEIEHYIAELKLNQSKCDIFIRNRRYEAMQKLIKEGNYFSEIEMMRREPLLYEQLIGQYLTQSEIRMRDRADSEPSFLNTLLESIDRNQIDELKKKQLLQEEEDDDTSQDSTSQQDTGRIAFSIEHPEDSDDDKFPKIPPEYKKQWGNFEDESENVTNSVVQLNKKKTNFKYVTSSEREMLREEFLGIMYSKFLSGYDKSFDYTIIDRNQEFDNLEIKTQDEEDKYFDSEEPNDTKDIKILETNSTTEDELDLYMKRINKEQDILNKTPD